MTVDRSEPALAEFWTSYVDGGRRGPVFAARHPGRLWAAFQAIRSLPVVDANPSDTPGGRAVRATLSMSGPLHLPARTMGTAVLSVPADPAEYLTGRSAPTRRTASPARATSTCSTTTCGWSPATSRGRRCSCR